MFPVILFQTFTGINMPIKVLHRMNWKNKAAPPCTMVDEYSIDGGDSWLSRKEFYQWHDDLIEIVDAYSTTKLEK